MQIIELDGKQSRVLSVEQGRPSLNILDLIDALISPKRRRYWFELELSEPESISLEEAKNLVIDKIVGNKWYREEQGKPDEIRERINACTSFEELFDNVSYHTNFRAETRRRNREAG